MNPILRNSVHNLLPGTIIRGKWHHCHYRIVRLLGRGATGDVYLAKSEYGQAALKVGHESTSIPSEVNILRKFSKMKGEGLGPSLFDVDDWQTSAGTRSFYVMEYLRGNGFLPFIRDHGEEWIGVLMIQLLKELDRLHHMGWVFGDLKPDNLLVMGPPWCVRWMDVGGITEMGRSVKEYTEFYDRGYWRLGTRKAEPSYDLFSIGMMMVNCAYPQRFEKRNGDFKQLKEALQGSSLLRRYRKIIFSALKGKYTEASAMCKDMVKVMKQVEPVGRQPRPKDKAKSKGRRKIYTGMEAFLYLSFLLIAYYFYLKGAG